MTQFERGGLVGPGKDGWVASKDGWCECACHHIEREVAE